jgi:hypothetical protein
LKSKVILPRTEETEARRERERGKFAGLVAKDADIV